MDISFPGRLPDRHYVHQNHSGLHRKGILLQLHNDYRLCSNSIQQTACW